MGAEGLDAIAGGLGIAVEALVLFKVDGPSEDEELGRSTVLCCNKRCWERGVSEDECDSVLECLDAYHIVSRWDQIASI